MSYSTNQSTFFSGNVEHYPFSLASLSSASSFSASHSGQGKATVLADKKRHKALRKLCRKAARKNLGLKKSDLNTAGNLAKVSELVTALMQSPLVNALPSPAKGEKKAARKLIRKLARQSLSEPVLSTDKTNAESPKLHKMTRLQPIGGSMAFALIPLKRKPCDGCAALTGGLCQCAIKLAKRREG